MRASLFRILLCFLLPVFLCSAAPQEEEQLLEVYELFEIQGLPGQIRLMISSTVEAQLKDAPDLAPCKEPLIDFLNSTSGYEAIRRDLAEIYIRHFTREEVRAITAFYQTPAGKKMRQESAEILKETTFLINGKLRKNADELLTKIRSMEKLPGTQDKR